MLQSKQFIKLPAAGRKILNEYLVDKDKHKLFSGIQENVNTQNTLNSKIVRNSMYRGILRKHMGFTEDDMKIIEVSKNVLDQYNNKLQESLSEQKTHTVTSNELKQLLDIPEMRLLITSGLRIDELLSNDSKFTQLHYTGGNLYFKLNKKKVDEFYQIHPLIDTEAWWKEYQTMKSNNENKSSSSIQQRINRSIKKILPETVYKLSTHLGRAIYANARYKLFNPARHTLPTIIKKYLNHESSLASAHYQHITLANDITQELFTSR